MITITDGLLSFAVPGGGVRCSADRPGQPRPDRLSHDRRRDAVHAWATRRFKWMQTGGVTHDGAASEQSDRRDVMGNRDMHAHAVIGGKGQGACDERLAHANIRGVLRDVEHADR